MQNSQTTLQNSESQNSDDNFVLEFLNKIENIYNDFDKKMKDLESKERQIYLDLIKTRESEIINEKLKWIKENK